MFCRSLFILLSFFFWPLCCLSFLDLQIRITPLVSSNSSSDVYNFFQWRTRLKCIYECICYKQTDKYTKLNSTPIFFTYSVQPINLQDCPEITPSFTTFIFASHNFTSFKWMKYSTLIQISCASRKLVKQQVNKGVNMGSWTSYLFASIESMTSIFDGDDVFFDTLRKTKIDNVNLH
jgi:hypothetical protein